MIGATGKLSAGAAPRRRNLFVWSENFAQSYWGKVGTSITANAITAPFGQADGSKLVESSASSNHYFALGSLPAAVYTASFYAKADGRSVLLVQFQDGSHYPYVSFDLSAGTATPALGASGTITAVGGGWYRCSITANTLTATCAIYAYLINGAQSYQGDGVSGIYLWGAQLVPGLRLTPYLATAGAARP